MNKVYWIAFDNSLNGKQIVTFFRPTNSKNPKVYRCGWSSIRRLVNLLQDNMIKVSPTALGWYLNMQDDYPFPTQS